MTAALASDYVSRGVSQTSGRPMVSAGVEAGAHGFYVGATAYNIDFRDAGDRDTLAEIDLYAGYEKQIGDTALDVGVIRYGYLNAPRNQPGIDFVEVYANAGHAFGPMILASSVYYTPEGPSGTGESWYGVVSGEWRVRERFAVSALAGRQIAHADGSYGTWSAGASFDLINQVTLDLRYWDTDRHDFGRPFGRHLVASASVSF